MGDLRWAMVVAPPGRGTVELHDATEAPLTLLRDWSSDVGSARCGLCDYIYLAASSRELAGLIGAHLREHEIEVLFVDPEAN